MTDRTTSRMNLSWGTVAKHAGETVLVLGGMLAWTVAGVAVYAGGNLFAQSGLAGRWVAIWLALGWVLALTLLRNRVMRLEHRLVEIRIRVDRVAPQDLGASPRIRRPARGRHEGFWPG
jgi:hypothetical protein